MLVQGGRASLKIRRTQGIILRALDQVNLADAKAHLSAIISRAAAGEAIQISRRGKPIAQLNSLPQLRELIELAALRALTDPMPKSTADNVVQTMRSESRYRHCISTPLCWCPRSRRMRRQKEIQFWLHQQDPAAPMISDWVVTEFTSALSIKLRTNERRIEDRAKAMSLVTRLKTESLTMIPVIRDHFVTAARFAEQHGIRLRAGDALHVTIGAEQGATICTLDKRLAKRATALGVPAELL